MEVDGKTTTCVIRHEEGECGWLLISHFFISSLKCLSIVSTEIMEMREERLDLTGALVCLN